MVRVPLTATESTEELLVPIFAFKVMLEPNIALPAPNKAPFNVPPLKVTVCSTLAVVMSPFIIEFIFKTSDEPILLPKSTLPLRVPPLKIKSASPLVVVMSPVIIPLVKVKSNSPVVVEILPVIFPAILVNSKCPEVLETLPVIDPDVLLVTVAELDPEEIFATTILSPVTAKAEAAPRLIVVASISSELVVRVTPSAAVTAANELDELPKFPLISKLLARVIVPTPSLDPITLPVTVPLLKARVEDVPNLRLETLILFEPEVSVLEASTVMEFRDLDVSPKDDPRVKLSRKLTVPLLSELPLIIPLTVELVELILKDDPLPNSIAVALIF